VALLHQLAAANLEAEAAKLHKLGWKWVEINPDLTGSELAQQPRISPGAHGFGPDSKTARLYAGAIVGIDHDGQLKVVTGVLKSDEAKALARARADKSEPPPPMAATSNATGGHLPATMIEELTSIMTAALRADNAKRPDLALALVVHDLVLPVFYELWESDKQLSEIRSKVTDVFELIKDAETCNAVVEIKGIIDGWRVRLPKKAFDLWPWLMAQEQGVLLELLGILASQNVNAVRYRYERTIPARMVSGNRLAHSLGLDMTKWWRPDTAFFARISKAAILTAIAEGVSPEVARGLDQGSKADLVAVAERKLNATTWLPEVLWTSEVVEEVVAIEDDNDELDAENRAAAE
jgi:ParB family chromosome partitioning protein